MSESTEPQVRAKVTTLDEGAEEWESSGLKADKGEQLTQKHTEESSEGFRGYMKKAWSVINSADSGPIAANTGRLLVCAYFLSIVVDKVEIWHQLRDFPPVRPRLPDEPVIIHSFPFIAVLLILPAALLTAAGILVPIFGSILAGFTIYDEAHLIWGNMISVIRYGSWPTELVVKRLALVGCVLLMLAHAFKETKVVRSYAGLLMSEEEPTHKRPGTQKSAALLIGRLLMAALIVLMGVNQFQRIKARGGALNVPPGASHHWGVQDAHDNNWLLLQLILAVPFVLGFQAKLASRLLALVLILESISCWQFWMPISVKGWPSWHYRSNVRLHFFTNLAMVGGLLMLQSLGHGAMTVDELMRKRD